MTPECITERKDSLIALKDKQGGKSKMTFRNDKNELVRVIEVDGCEIREGKRCDFLVLHPKENKKKLIEDEYFVELKGKKVKYACEQLEVSIKRLSENPVKKFKCAIVICTKNPMAATQTQKLKIRFKKEFNAKLIIEKNQYIHKLS